MKSGFVTIIGRPNTGKSTLLNSIIGEKVAIISEKPQTTRNLIQGIYNEEDTQIVFVDTPGIHKPIDKMGQALNAQAYYSIKDVDILLLVIDASVSYGKGDQFMIDKLSENEILLKINEYKDLYEFSEIIPISALKKDNIDRLIKVLKNYLPDSVKYFPDNETTTAEIDFRLSEIVREKLFIHMNEEVPHSISFKLINYEKNKNIISIYVDIIVDREYLKKIIIGKNGDMIKVIGREARLDMEELLGKKVYLELYCKTIKKWREKEKYIKDLGYLVNNE